MGNFAAFPGVEFLVFGPISKPLCARGAEIGIFDTVVGMKETLKYESGKVRDKMFKLAFGFDPGSDIRRCSAISGKHPVFVEERDGARYPVKNLAVRILAGEGEVPDDAVLLKLVEVFGPFVRTERGVVEVLAAYRADDAFRGLKVLEIVTRICEECISEIGIRFPERIRCGFCKVAKSLLVLLKPARRGVAFRCASGKDVGHFVYTALYRRNFVTAVGAVEANTEFSGTDRLKRRLCNADPSCQGAADQEGQRRAYEHDRKGCQSQGGHIPGSSCKYGCLGYAGSYQDIRPRQDVGICQISLATYRYPAGPALFVCKARNRTPVERFESSAGGREKLFARLRKGEIGIACPAHLSVDRFGNGLPCYGRSIRP